MEMVVGAGIGKNSIERGREGQRAERRADLFSPLFLVLLYTVLLESGRLERKG